MLEVQEARLPQKAVDLAKSFRFHRSLGTRNDEFRDFCSRMLEMSKQEEQEVSYNDASSNSVFTVPFPKIRQQLVATGTERVKFAFVTSEATERAVAVSDDFSNIETTFLRNKTTVIITHGWLQSVDSQFTRNLAAAFVSKYSVNVFMTDWGDDASFFGYVYESIFAQEHVPLRISALMVYMLRKNLVSSSELFLVGYSLGAHASGIACKIFERTTSQKPGRLDGLDPPWCGFQPYMLGTDDPNFRFDENDATLVTALYTSSIACSPIAQVNFFFNGKKYLHPGLGSSPWLVDQHRMAVRYYTDSCVNSGIPYLGRKATSWDAYGSGETDGNEIMGVAMNLAARPGNYFVRTGDKSPFALHQQQ